MQDTKYVIFFFFTGIYRQKHDELERWRKVNPDGRTVEKVLSSHRWEWDGARFVEEQRKWPKWYQLR